MIDLEKTFEEIEDRARRTNGLGYGIRAFLPISLIYLVAAALQFGKVLTLDFPIKLLCAITPVLFFALAYLVGKKRKPDLHEFTYRMDERLETGGKLSSLYKLKQRGQEKALSALLAREFIVEAPNWKKAFQLPLSTYLVGAGAAVFFSIAVFLMFFPGPGSQIATVRTEEGLRTKNGIVLDEETSINKLKSPDNSVEKQAPAGETEETFPDSNSEKKSSPSGGKRNEKREAKTATGQKIPELSRKEAPAGEKNLKANGLSSIKKTEKLSGNSSSGTSGKKVTEIAQNSTGKRAPETGEKSSNNSGDSKEGGNRTYAKKEEKAEPGNLDSTSKGESSSGKYLNRGTGGKEEKSEASGGRKEGRSSKKRGLRGRAEGSEGFPRIENDEEKGQSWRAGNAKRDPDAKDRGGGPERATEFSTKNVPGEMKKTSTLPGYLDMGNPIKEETTSRGGTTAPAEIEKIRSVLENRGIDPGFASVIRDYFASIRKGGQ